MAKRPVRSRPPEKLDAPGAPAAPPALAKRAAAALDTRSDSMSSEPNEEDIRLRAYQRYLERGGDHGLAFDDWVEAERELKNRK